MSSLRSRVNAEIEALRVEFGGVLKQQQIVDFARKEGSALHEDFARRGLWNDQHAAEVARLEYAGRLIRLYVIKPQDDSRGNVRALVSLVDDRKPKSGGPGYRHIDDVMRDDDLRENLLATALMELRAFRRKYEHLKELAAVWPMLEQIERTQTRQQKPSEMHIGA